MVKIESVRHSWQEKAGFVIDRPNGHKHFTFLHFFGGVELLVGGRIVKTAPHACILYNIGTPQYFCSKTTLTHDWMHLSGNLIQKLQSVGLEPDRLYYPAGNHFITAITQEIETEYFADRSCRDALLELKTQELLIKLSRACSGQLEPGVDIDTEERIRKLRADVFLSLGHPWTVAEMAQSVGLSESRFYAVYRSVFSNSPTDDLIKARIDSAKNALLFGTGTVSQIAESLGYNNVTHFIRQFKSLTGFSPASFRANGER